MSDTHEIYSDHLGDMSPRLMERFARFCTAVAKEAGFDIEFTINYRCAGWQAMDAASNISGICWDYGSWYGSGPLRKVAITEAAKLVKSFVDSDEKEVALFD